MLLRIFAALLGCMGLLGIGLALRPTEKLAPTQQVVVPAEITPLTRPKANILVAARSLRSGALLVPADLDGISVNVGQEPAGSYADTVAARTALLGGMIRRSLNPKDPITPSDVLVPGDRGFLAAVLAPGMRAVTVGVDEISGTAGLIWPGDHVDLILTQTIDEKTQPLARRVSGETALTDLRVIAVDQDLLQGGRASVENHKAVANNNRTVTLEASSFDAERIAVASRIGRISLVIRSAADGHVPSDSQVLTGDAKAANDNATAVTLTPNLASPSIAWAGDVSPALRQTAGEKSSVIRVYRGKDVEEVPF